MLIASQAMPAASQPNSLASQMMATASERFDISIIGNASGISGNASSIRANAISTLGGARIITEGLRRKLSSKFGMIKEVTLILRRQKQDCEARKESFELHQMSGENIENSRYIQRDNQFLIINNKSLATKISWFFN
ncbi:unnamed protein product [Rotaria sp. Silwood2]|nr:unnamed protein product [Rotaria sp. Silwood2]CAF2835588.1 unnamed protein product [Rotaria sp. Silwood2]CAF3093217.1 unnamed protein product [Rotaria sp. Silwood2]CAF3159145.1 unnamed protein product [Rotaria sp. Silwood2]CAF4026578.1 unnamed protein product [Rotaria sp. Silwood2]